MTTVQDKRVEELAGRVREFHGVELSEALEIIDYLRDGEDSVLVGGSLAYGLGNQKSDLDIVVAGRATKESSSRMPLEHFLETLRVDVWKLREDEIEELFQRAQKGLESDAPFEGAFGDVFEQADLKLLHRVAYGVIIDGPALIPTGTRNYREVARDLLVREYAERMRHALYVSRLALGAQQFAAAAMNARFGVEDALQAVIAARGLPFSDNKWLQVRLEKDTPDLREVYRPFAVLPEGGAATKKFVEAAIEQVEKLSGLRLDADSLSSDASWEAPDLRLIPAGDLKALVSPEQDVVFELDANEADAWKALDGGPSWPCASCTDIQMKVCYRLYANGMAKLLWARGLPLDQLSMEGVSVDAER